MSEQKLEALSNINPEKANKLDSLLCKIIKLDSVQMTDAIFEYSTALEDYVGALKNGRGNPEQARARLQAAEQRMNEWNHRHGELRWQVGETLRET